MLIKVKQRNRCSKAVNRDSLTSISPICVLSVDESIHEQLLGFVEAGKKLNEELQCLNPGLRPVPQCGDSIDHLAETLPVDVPFHRPRKQHGVKEILPFDGIKTSDDRCRVLEPIAQGQRSWPRGTRPRDTAYPAHPRPVPMNSVA